MKATIALALALAACSAAKGENEAKDPTTTPADRVRAKAALYLEHAAEAADEWGFLYGKCDSLEFTAISAAVGYAVDLHQAEGGRGQWFRHALHDCYDLDGQPGGSASDISGDMLLGLAWFAWNTGDRDLAVGVIDYGKAHFWRMGRGDVFRTVMRPGLIWTYYEIAKKLGANPGPAPTAAELNSVLELSIAEENAAWPLRGGVAPLAEAALSPTGYEADLEVMHTLLDAHVNCGASDAQVATLRRQAERQPRNAFFQASYHLYADGDQTVAYSVLDDETLFPSDRLPTRRDRCEMWLWHRDEGDDWAACPFDADVDRPHAGMDLRWALAVADNQLRKCQ